MCVCLEMKRDLLILLSNERKITNGTEETDPDLRNIPPWAELYRRRKSVINHYYSRSESFSIFSIYAEHSGPQRYPKHVECICNEA